MRRSDARPIQRAPQWRAADPSPPPAAPLRPRPEKRGLADSPGPPPARRREAPPAPGPARGTLAKRESAASRTLIRLPSPSCGRGLRASSERSPAECRTGHPSQRVGIGWDRSGLGAALR
ncbi:MAG: hypothetical protein DWQ01_00490 [Planctomycetota bacterium]|nr:MAG: hypothetical protein DWQ01_00490 [Planctomycetota bacterium]